MDEGDLGVPWNIAAWGRKEIKFFKIQKRKRQVLLMLACGLQLVIFGALGEGEAAGSPAEGKRETFTATKVFSGDFQPIYSELFDSEHFQLMGKLMTVFLHDKDKGYRLTPGADDAYSIRSRSTIQEGSEIRIHELSGESFIFSGDLILKKGITFPCTVEAKIRYDWDGPEMRCVINITYQTLPIVRGLDQGLRFFTGKNFIADKVTSFLEGMHLVAERLAGLSLEEWRRIADDQDFLSHLVFPVTFSPEEREKVERVLISYGAEKTGLASPPPE